MSWERVPLKRIVGLTGLSRKHVRQILRGRTRARVPYPSIIVRVHRMCGRAGIDLLRAKA